MFYSLYMNVFQMQMFFEFFFMIYVFVLLIISFLQNSPVILQSMQLLQIVTPYTKYVL